MATVSTVPSVKAGLVAKIAANTSVETTYAWPGPQTRSEAIFFGRHPELQDLRVDGTHEIPNIKAGRKQRQEAYDLDLTVWAFRPELSSADAQTVEERVFAIAETVEDVLADDPTAGLSQVQLIQVNDVTATLWPFQKGWACELVLQLNVRARLT